MKAKELMTMGDAELKQKLQELSSSLQKDRAQSATGTPPKNTLSIRQSRRTIARILTVLNQKKEEIKKEKQT